jgi:hypothetical protein
MKAVWQTFEREPTIASLGFRPVKESDSDWGSKQLLDEG